MYYVIVGSIKRLFKDKEIKTKGIVSNEQLDHKVYVAASEVALEITCMYICT